MGDLERERGLVAGYLPGGHCFRDEMGVRFVQFIPIVERATEELLQIANLGWSAERKEKRPLYTQEGTRVTDRSVTAEGYGRFPDRRGRRMDPSRCR